MNSLFINSISLIKQINLHGQQAMCVIMEKEKTNDLTPERVKQILKKKGTEVDLEEAEAILEFVKKIAHIAVNQYLRGKL